ncbi:MAG: hypothetical protein NTY03_07635, partial [Candidatus Bathyarchaeota archaeon]|nr:hypothetical protein [Candidatus Bathyarchaeota archaeon]
MSHPSATYVPKTWKVTSLATLSLIALTTLLGAVTYASIAIAPSPEQLFAGSDLVVTGKVLDINTRWGQGNESSIITVMRLEVEGVAKGELHEGIIEVNYPGGRVGELEIWVEDQPTFTVGEHVLLYLESESTPLNGAPRYALTSERIFGKSDATGNTTIGADGKQVPIVGFATDVVEANHIWIDELIFPSEVHPQGETYYVTVSVVARLIPIEVPNPTRVKSYPVTVNGNLTGVSITVSLMPNERKTFNATLELMSL